MDQMRNLIGLGDISLQWWEALYSRCCDIIAKPDDYIDSCKGKILASMFFEPSTRTSFSFQAAAQRLGGSAFGFADPLGTSVSKGETLADTVRIVSSYADTVVIRSPMEGASAAAVLYSDVPVINAGDGGHFHPTQTLADLTTIAQKRGRIGDLCIGLCGDLKYGRTVHSIVEALSIFPNVRFCLISPNELRMPEYVLDKMRMRGQEFTETALFAESLPELDILYMTRIQRERFEDVSEYLRLKGVYVLTNKDMQHAKHDMLVMHPLPRHGEIDPEVDSDPRAIYFEQARYGMYIRMALLLDFFHLPKLTPNPIVAFGDTQKCQNPACITQTESYLVQTTPVGAAGKCRYCDKDFV
ncbi:MAG: aspartate carbamoyltransferase [Oscillospiraceae bacterium]|nr:aspartate carbamoyltransferase [Oscillospiraceae bacterium]